MEKDGQRCQGNDKDGPKDRDRKVGEARAENSMGKMVRKNDSKAKEEKIIGKLERTE